jgi:AmmeMemoRadiSam system protein B
MMERNPSVAGMFYPGDPGELRAMLGSFFGGAREVVNALGVVSPHAGYVYSGSTAARAISAFSVDFDGTVIVIGPSHAGYLTCVSALPWRTPLGLIESDLEFISYLDITTDEFSHRDEHSIEVQVPFIQFQCPKARFVPIIMGDQTFAGALNLADLIIRAIEATQRDVRVVASSDFSHYIPEHTARSQDLYAIEALSDLNIEEFYRRIWEKGVSACGYGPIAAMITICRHLGAERAELLSYTTSAETTGDASQVVGYAAIAVI